MNLIAYLKLDTSDFDANAAGAKQELAALGTTSAGADNALAQTTRAMSSLNAASKAIEAPALSTSGLAAAATAADAAAGSMRGLEAAGKAIEAPALSTSGLAAAATAADAAAGSMRGLDAAGKAATKATDGLAESAKKVAPAAGKATGGLSAVSAVSGLASGSMTGTASGAMALSSSLKSLGLASAVPIAAIAAIIASLAMIAKYYITAQQEAAKLNAAIRLENADSGVNTLRRGFEKLVDTMDGAVGLMRELRALTQEGVNVDSDKHLAQIELDRKRELAAVAPGDKADKQAKAINARYDRQRTGVELDREQGGNTAAAAEARKQQQENAAAIAARQQQVGQLEAARDTARKNVSNAATADAPGFWSDLVSRLPGMGGADGEQEKAVTGWGEVATKSAEEADRIRQEVEELERKNVVLAAQAALYEKRNEVVAIKRQANAVDDRDLGDKKAPKGKDLKVETDRLTRIGGVTNGGFGASSKSDAIADKQLSEQRLMRAALERIARKEAGAVLA